jgi:hypothetical protein
MFVVSGIFTPVERSLRAIVRAQDVKGNWFELDGMELTARCMLHETDHCDGIVFLDKMSSIKREIVKRKIRKTAESWEVGLSPGAGSSDRKQARLIVLPRFFSVSSVSSVPRLKSSWIASAISHRGTEDARGRERFASSHFAGYYLENKHWS